MLLHRGVAYINFLPSPTSNSDLNSINPRYACIILLVTYIALYVTRRADDSLAIYFVLQVVFESSLSDTQAIFS